MNIINYEQVDLIIATETWHRSHPQYNLQGGTIAWTPPSEHQGIVVLASAAITCVRSFHPALWTPSTIILKVTVQSKTEIFIIGHYSKPGAQADLDKELELAMTTIRSRNPFNKIVVAGDLNRN